MDPLTHTATGLFLSRAGLKRWTPMATPILLLAANAPDIDIVTAAGGPLNYLRFHRHLTHSLLAMPVMALLPVLLVWAVARKPVRWAGAFAAALIAVASHLALDLTNVYGVRLLLPFSGRWLRLDQTNVVDLWIWAVILVAIAGPVIGGLVGSEITSGSAKARHHGRGFAVLALVFLLVYNCGRGILHARATAVLDSRIYQRAEPLRVAALPDPANPWRWRGLVETRDFFALSDLNLLGEFDPMRATILHKPESSPATDAELAAAGRTYTFQQFQNFAQWQLWRITPVAEPENGRQVELMDLRFGSPAEPGFRAVAILTSGLQVIETSFEFGRLRPR